MPMKTTRKRAFRIPTPTNKTREVLDVGMTAELLMVSTDTVYDLLKSGELPGRKVGRKWLTTRSVVLRWIESSSEHDTLARAIEGGDRKALSKALTSGKATVR
jgi:excisionase family DNA binding protein